MLIGTNGNSFYPASGNVDLKQYKTSKDLSQTSSMCKAYIILQKPLVMPCLGH